MHSCYDAWLSEPSFTKGGNMKPPQRSLLCDWVRVSWECVSRGMIKESFMSCAITTFPSGSDDDQIHCFKPGQPCEAGRSVLAEAMEKLNSSLDSGDADDPFASNEDEDEVFSYNNNIYSLCIINQRCSLIVNNVDRIKLMFFL